MTYYIKKSGAWKEAVPYVKKAGSWKVADQVWIKKSGVWKLGFQNTIEYTSAGTRTSVSIFADFGSPSQVGNYVWINNGNCESGPAGTYGATTGIFPAGSTLTIINNGYIRGRGGKGGDYYQNTVGKTTTQFPLSGLPGQNALNISFSCTVENTANGYIYGGGGGGGAGRSGIGGSVKRLGNGGAGANPGPAGSNTGNTANAIAGSPGTQTAGGAAVPPAGGGGGLGNAGNSGTGTSGGAAGKAIAKNGYVVVFTAGNNATQVKGAIS